MAKPKFDISMLGDRELKSSFDDLSKGLQTRYTKKALEGGSQIILRTWRRQVPKDTGAYAKGLKSVSMKRSRKRLGYRIAAPTRKELAAFHDDRADTIVDEKKRLSAFDRASRIGDKENKWYYPAILEWGGVRKDGTVIPPRAPGRKAFAIAKDAATIKIRQVLWNQINALALRKGKKHLRDAAKARA